MEGPFVAYAYASSFSAGAGCRRAGGCCHRRRREPLLLGKREEGRVVRDERRDIDGGRPRVRRCVHSSYRAAKSGTTAQRTLLPPPSSVDTPPVRTAQLSRSAKLAAHLVLGGGGGDEARRWVEVGTPSPHYWATRGSPYPVREASIGCTSGSGLTVFQ